MLFPVRVFVSRGESRAASGGESFLAGRDYHQLGAAAQGMVQVFAASGQTVALGFQLRGSKCGVEIQ